jgi:hypothetical protein
MIENSAVTNTRTTAQSREGSRGPRRTADGPEPPEDEPGSPRPPRKGRIIHTTTDFVFVNEANHSPQFKALKRHTVRSQARIHSARLLKQKHKTELRPLAPQKRGHSASRFLPHDKIRPLAILEGRIRTVAGSDSDSKPLAHSNDPSSGDDVTLSVESSPEGVDINTTVSRISNSQGKLEFYRKIFGTKSDSIRITTTQPRNSSYLSPRALLGAGRVDPFLSYPRQEPDIHELADLCKSSNVVRRSSHWISILIFHPKVPNSQLPDFTYILPGIYPHDHPYQLDSGNSVGSAWFSAAVANRFLFNILLWAACVKRDVLRGSRTYCNSAQALLYKVDGMRQLNEVLSNGKKALTDEVILAIGGLASHEVVNVTEEKIKPFNSPLQSAGFLNTYGGLQMVSEHRNAVLRVIALRGGIDNLRINGLAECLVM